MNGIVQWWMQNEGLLILIGGMIGVAFALVGAISQSRRAALRFFAAIGRSLGIGGTRRSEHISVDPVWQDAEQDDRRPGERVEAYLIRTAETSVKFLTISGRSIFDGKVEENLHMQLSRPDFRFQLILFDWNAPSFGPKMQAERRISPAEILGAREKAAAVAKSYCALAQEHGGRLSVRLHSNYPIWRMVIVDRSIGYVGYYLEGKRGYEGPMFVLNNKRGEASLLKGFGEMFDRMWEECGPDLEVGDARLQVT